MKELLRVRQIASTIGKDPRQVKVVKGLGLRGPGSHVVVANTPSFRGMIKKVIHLVHIEEIDQAAGSPAKA